MTGMAPHVLRAGASRRLAGAAFDVFAVEPLLDRELLEEPNLLATPHLGGSTEEAILAMGRAAISNLESPARPLELLKRC